ncbi:hypothetical protein ACPC54_18630 [Kitasatospora sp. NPDC094028]
MSYLLAAGQPAQVNDLGNNLGLSLGTGGPAMVLFVVLILMVKKGGNDKIKKTGYGMMMLSFAATTTFTAAGGPFATSVVITRTLLMAVMDNPKMVNVTGVGMAACILAFAVLRKHSLVRGAWTGHALAVSFALSGAAVLLWPAQAIAQGISTMHLGG